MGASQNVVLLRRLTSKDSVTLHVRYRNPRLAQGHLLPLLSVFVSGGCQHAIYPCPHGSLWTLWAENPLPNIDNIMVRGVAVQIAGILGAISILPKPDEDLQQQYMVPEPARIMWFSSFGPLGRLVVSDLAVSLDCPDAEIEAYGVRNSEYSAPEVCPFGSPNWPHSAVWTLGCVFLELLAWIIEGKRGVELFRKQRWREDKPASFFETRASNSGETLACVKTEVTEVSFKTCWTDFRDSQKTDHDVSGSGLFMAIDAAHSSSTTPSASLSTNCLWLFRTSGNVCRPRNFTRSLMSSV